MRYQVFKSDTNKFFIVDSLNDLIFCYCGDKKLAEQTAQSLNTLCDETVNLTKIH